VSGSEVTTTRSGGTTSEVFLGRQRVVDADRALFGFELLHRGGPHRSTAIDDPDAATRTVMERVLLQWGMEHVVGDTFGLVNASPSLVGRGLHRAMPPEGMILEMREPEPFDEATVAALQEARFEGYHFALDNVGRLADLERSQLLPLASIVKIELTTAHDLEIPRLIDVARHRSPGVLVVAEKVEAVDDFTRCVEHGFDLFQGYYLAEPEVLRRPARPTSGRASVALGEALNGSGIDVDLLESIVASDPSLAFRLLAAVNANAFGLDRDVHSLDQAMALLGHEKLRCLAELLASTTETVDEPRHVEQVERGATRALMAVELLRGTELERSGVTVALLSNADEFYESPLAELLGELPVTDEIRAALLHGQGRLGITLDIIRACERRDLTALGDLAPGREAEMCDLLAVARRRASTPATGGPGSR
jgi:EAL and modified HD-GYP domain-containing signal transduction protein